MTVKKECFKCGETKHLAEFYKHKEMADGHLNKCKECSKVDVRENYRNNIKHFKKYEKNRACLPHRVKARKEYAKTEKGRVAGNNGREAWDKRNPIKKGASIMIGNAVRSKKMFKPAECSSCGKTPNRIHGHHNDYAFPMVVTWLCAGCHTAWHRKNGEALNG